MATAAADRARMRWNCEIGVVDCSYHEDNQSHSDQLPDQLQRFVGRTDASAPDSLAAAELEETDILRSHC